MDLILVPIASLFVLTTLFVIPMLLVLLATWHRRTELLSIILSYTILITCILFLLHGIILLLFPWASCPESSNEVCEASFLSQLYLNIGTIIIGLALSLALVLPRQIRDRPWFRFSIILSTIIAAICGVYLSKLRLSFPWLDSSPSMAYWVLVVTRHFVPLVAYLVLCVLNRCGLVSMPVT
jgi:hypothetical protein